MRRGLVFIALAAVLFAVAAVAGFSWMARTAPGWLALRIEQQLSAGLGAPVSVGEVDFRVRRGLRVEIRGIELGPTPERLRVEVGRAVAWVDPLALIVGRLELSRLELEHPVVIAPDDPEAPGRGDALLAGLPRALAALRTGPVRSVEIRGARLVLMPPSAAAPGRSPTPEEGQLALAGVVGRVSRGRLTDAVDLVLEGRVGESDGNVHLAGRFDHSRDRLAIEFEALDLAALPRPVRTALGLERVSGTLRGAAQWSSESVGSQQVALELAGVRISGRRLAGAGAFALGRPKLSAELSIGTGEIRIESAHFQDGDAPVVLRGRSDWPLRDDGRIELSLEVRNLSVDEAVRFARELPFPHSAPEDRFLARLTDGRVSQLRVSLDSNGAGARAMLAGDALARPGDLTVDVTVEDVAIEISESEVLSGLSGGLAYDGDVLELRGVEATFDGAVLPRLDARVTGIAEVRAIDELRCRMPAATAGSLPGIAPLARYLDAREKHPELGPSWTRAQIRAEWISHPVLLCGLEQLDLELRPTPSGVDAMMERGVYAGVDLAGRARYRRADADGPMRIELELRVGPPFESMALEPPAEPWARGHVFWEIQRAGPWRFHSIDADFHTTGDRVLLERGTIELDPGGAIDGNALLDLSSGEQVAYEAALHGKDLDVTQLAAAATIAEPERLSGTLTGELSAAGPLVDYKGPLYAAEGRLRFRAESGTVKRDLGVLFALLTADTPLQPLIERDAIGYDTVDFDGHFSESYLHGDEAVLLGPSVRMLAAGRLDVEKPNRLDAVVGVLFFPPLDTLIDRVPLLNRILLGNNNNLFGAYYTLKGPFVHPDARFIPAKSLTAGPASFVLEDIPTFLWSGLKRIQSMLVPEQPTTPKADS